MLSLPERGTPIDTGIIYELINELNTLSHQVYGAGKSSKIITPTSSNDSLTSDLRVYGMYKNIQQDVQAGDTVNLGNVAYPGSFKYAPVAVATPVTTGNGIAEKDFVLSLTSVTTGSVGLRVLFKNAGPVDMRINIIAIGIPEGVA